MNIMTSRERILSAIRHQEADSVPVDLGSTPSSGISAVAYDNLKKYMGISKGSTYVYDVVQQLAQPEKLILDTFNVDVVDIGRTFNQEVSCWHEIELVKGFPFKYPKCFSPEREIDGSWNVYKNGCLIARMPQGATFFDQACFPFRNGWPDDFSGLDGAMENVLWAALVHSPWDHAADAGFWNDLRDKTLMLRRETDRALMVVCGCNLFEWGSFLRGMDNFLMDLVLEEAKTEALLDKLLEHHLKFLEKVCSHVGDIVDIIRFGDDLGMDIGPFMAPEIYRKFFKPRHKILCDYVKKHSSMHTLLHSCGSIYKLIPDLIEAGYEIINPVQINCREMEPFLLKKEFGSDITFWGGGCDTRRILNHGTEQEVRDHVKRNIDIFAPGGGFIFSTVHNIMPDVPPQNIVALFDEVWNSGDCL